MAWMRHREILLRNPLNGSDGTHVVVYYSMVVDHHLVAVVLCHAEFWKRRKRGWRKEDLHHHQISPPEVPIPGPELRRRRCSRLERHRPAGDSRWGPAGSDAEPRVWRVEAQKAVRAICGDPFRKSSEQWTAAAEVHPPIHDNREYYSLIDNW